MKKPEFSSVRRAVLILFLLLLSALIPIPLVRADPGWLTGWEYRKSHTITGTVEGAQTDYQVKITVHYGDGSDDGDDVYTDSKCKTDFGDIRFTKSDGKSLLDYWIEDKIDSDNAIIWIEVDSIPESPENATIYVYYGKADATTISDGDKTFQFFDNFTYADCPTNHGWTEIDAFGTYSYQTVAGELEISATGSVGTHRVGLRDDNFIGNSSIDYKTRITNFYAVIVFYDSIIMCQRRNVNYYQVVFGNVNFDGKVRYSGDWSTVYTLSFRPSVATTYKVSQRAYGTRIETIIDDVSEGNGVDANLVSGYGSIGVHRVKAYFDDYRVRNYVYPEPINGDWGSEEIPPIMETPAYLFGAGFNASSPYVSLYWTTNLTGITLFEVQNSTDKISWTYLGSNTTAEYHDFQVVNGTERYYRVRACNYTDSVWDNSTFTDINFETVYFVMVQTAGVGAALRPEGWVLTVMIALIGGALIILGTTRRR